MNLHQILLQPTDVLFFRDGRPMSGSLAGHTAAWPLPDVTNHALHAALHRASLAGVHGHDHINAQGKRAAKDNRKFGSLVTAGPFPVRGNRWFFPRPKDAQLNGSIKTTHQPLASLATDGNDNLWINSSLPDPLKYAVVNTEPPSKEAGGEPWLSQDAFDAYLRGQNFNPKSPSDHYLRDTDLADTEHQIGIGINPETGTTVESQFYSAHYLRLREEVRLGLFAEAMDKINGDNTQKRDLIRALLDGHPAQIIVGGQQRLCTSERHEVTGALPLPMNLMSKFNRVKQDGRENWLVKWVLLSPAIWPEIKEGNAESGEKIHGHTGGWLPNWIAPSQVPFEGETVEAGGVLLLDGPGKEKAKRKNLNRGKRIAAKLVAAIVGKPIPVTGYALANEADPERGNGGAKSTHLAVPAGSVYYFECCSSEAATVLANALNWHGVNGGGTIQNRRSTLMGEKGFGLGVCGTWKFHSGDIPGQPNI
jgi:CRISPR type III-B/RAMP module-associated protein Cmr3